MPAPRLRAAIAFVVLFTLYQSAEGVGERLLGNSAVQGSLMVACVLAAWPLSRWLGYRGYGAWALGWRSPAARWLVLGLALAFLAKWLALIVGRAHGIYVPTPDAQPADAATLAGLLPMLLLSTFVASVAEDILTRGFWYRAAGIRWQRGVAFVAVSSLAYVLNHIYRLGEGPVEWLMLACFGVAYATALWRSGTLWAAVGLHWGWNLANGVFDLLLPLDAADRAAGSLLSAGVHLAMAACLLALPRTRAGNAPAAQGTPA